MLEIQSRIDLAADRLMHGPVVTRLDDDTFRLFDQITMRRGADGTIEISDRRLAPVYLGDLERQALAFYRVLLTRAVNDPTLSPAQLTKVRHAGLADWLTTASESVSNAFYTLADWAIDNVHEVCGNHAGRSPLTINSYNRLVALWGAEGDGGLCDLLPTHWPAIILLNRMNALAPKKRSKYAFGIDDVCTLPARLEKSVFGGCGLWLDLIRIHPDYIYQFQDPLAYALMQHENVKNVDVGNVVMRLKRAPSYDILTMFEHGPHSVLVQAIDEQPGSHDAFTRLPAISCRAALDVVAMIIGTDIGKTLTVVPSSGRQALTAIPLNPSALPLLLAHADSVDLEIGKNEIVFKNLKSTR